MIPPGTKTSSDHGADEHVNDDDNEDDYLTKGFGDGATVEHFVRVLTDIQNTFTISQESDSIQNKENHVLVKFFIASNTLSVKQQILESFPSIAIMDPLVGDRSTVEAMRLALIEWLMLSRSSLIIHTFGSSFAVEAARIHQVPIIGIWSGHLLHHSSQYLPDCGTSGYQVLSQPDEAKTYYKESLDGASMETKSVRWRPCDLLREWGFTQTVYCSVK